MRKYLVALAALALAACNPMAQMNGADEQIDQFHELYTAQDLDALYGMTAPELREVTSRGDWDQLIALVHHNLGGVVESSQEGFNVNTENGETTTVITRTTTYEQGEGTETYTFFGSGDDMRLVGWEVVSDALINAESPPQPAPGPAPAPAMGGEAKPGAPAPPAPAPAAPAPAAEGKPVE